MISKEYEPREEVINIRPIGKFGTPNPGNYLGPTFDESKNAHPSQQSKKDFKKPKVKLETEELLNLIRAIVMVVGTLAIAAGVAIAIGFGYGLVSFGIGSWAIGLLMLRAGDAPSDRE